MPKWYALRPFERVFKVLGVRAHLECVRPTRGWALKSLAMDRQTLGCRYCGESAREHGLTGWKRQET